MVEELFTDEQRRLLLSLALIEQLQRPHPLNVEVISRLAGTDTVIVAKRAYPSLSERSKGAANDALDASDR